MSTQEYMKKMKKKSVPPHVVMKVPGWKEPIDIVETEGRKKLLVRTDWKYYIDREGFQRIKIQMGFIQVREADKPLKLECSPLPPSVPAEFLMNPVGVTYYAYDFACRRFHREDISCTTVLMQPTPLQEKSEFSEKTELVFETPVPKPSQLYFIVIYAEIRVLKFRPLWYAVEDLSPELARFFKENNDIFKGTKKILGKEEKEEKDKNAPNLPFSAPVCYLGFSFLNDQGEWEPLNDFELEAASKNEVDSFVKDLERSDPPSVGY
jgi:hypothetical protein